MQSFDRQVLKKSITTSVKRIYEAQTTKMDLYRNTLDCFSSVIDSTIQDISLEEWMKQENTRQVQKTKQNAIGTLHENAIGSIPGVNNLPVGMVIDIESKKFKIIAEIKNKHNTTKGNHKVQVYQDLEKMLKTKKGYIGYYVEILPRGGNTYNKPFCPSNNRTHSKVLPREDIRIIDGKSFYTLLTGNENALKELYDELPSLVAEIIKDEFGVNNKINETIKTSTFFEENFNKAYQVNPTNIKK